MYEWQKPLDIPRHSDPKAPSKLLLAMKDAAARLRSPVQQPACMDFMDGVRHPDMNGDIISFTSRGSQTIHGAPLRVDVFPRDTFRGRHRAYTFHLDGRVVVEAERNPYRESAAGPDLKEDGRIQGWPEGVSHMFRYIAQTLRASADWEIQTAENLEIMDPEGESRASDLELLKHPAMR